MRRELEFECWRVFGVGSLFLVGANEAAWILRVRRFEVNFGT